jgi:hypothetical protein
MSPTIRPNLSPEMLPGFTPVTIPITFFMRDFSLASILAPNLMFLAEGSLSVIP